MRSPTLCSRSFSGFFFGMGREMYVAAASILETYHNMYEDCIWPGGLVGRACIMQKHACDAAKNKFDDVAWKMTIATQMQNRDAVGALSRAGAWKVAESLRNNRGCR
jgi:hypothetical protein